MIALIGAGPLGIELAVALKRLGLPYTHFEAGQIGATMAWWAPGTRWFSSNERIAIAGVPLVTPAQEKATREEYLAYLRGIVEQFNLDIRTYTRVTGIARDDNVFRISYQNALTPEYHPNLLAPPQRSATDPPDTPNSLHADKVILVTGGTATPNLLNIPGENLPHVSHYFQDPHAYFQKNLLIVGGRNSAVEAALRCHRAGAKVHFSYHGPAVDAKDIKYWLYPEFSSLIKAGKIIPHFNTRLTQITPTHVELAPNAAPETQHSVLSPQHFKPQHLEMDFLLLMTGYRADLSLASAAGVTLTGDQQLPTYNPATMETNVPGIYIAGTAIAGTQHRYKVFLENCHTHVSRITAHLTGNPPPPDAAVFDRPES